MSRIIDKPCAVTLGRVEDWPALAPVSFALPRERPQVVSKILDCWMEAGRWWEQEPETENWRVKTVNGGVFELARPTGTQSWRLYKAYD